VKGKSNFLLIGSLIVGAIVLGLGLLKYGHTEKAKAGATAGAPSSARAQDTTKDLQPIYWYDPMVPEKHFDKPGKSPFMDMQLLARYPDDATGSTSAHAGSIAIDPRVVQNLGVRLGVVEPGTFARAVDTVGVVAVDEHRIEAIEIRQPGWVEELSVRAVGDSVRRGQQLAGIYSPDLLATQQELLIARESADSRLIEAARRRLVLFGLSASQIAHIEKTGQAERRVDYYAPFDGYVMELGARQGSAVNSQRWTASGSTPKYPRRRPRGSRPGIRRRPRCRRCPETISRAKSTISIRN